MGEVEETASSGAKTVTVLAAMGLGQAPVGGTMVVASSADAAARMTVGTVRVGKGVSLEARYKPVNGSERLLRVGQKRDGAEAWISKGAVRLGWIPVAGDVL